MTIEQDELRAALRKLLESPALPDYASDPKVLHRTGQMIAQVAEKDARQRRRPRHHH